MNYKERQIVVQRKRGLDSNSGIISIIAHYYHLSVFNSWKITSTCHHISIFLKTISVIRTIGEHKNGVYLCNQRFGLKTNVTSLFIIQQQGLRSSGGENQTQLFSLTSLSTTCLAMQSWLCFIADNALWTSHSQMSLDGLWIVLLFLIYFCG